MRNARGTSGFTLLELIIAVTIFSVSAVAVYSSFNVGIRAWRKAEESYKVRQQARYAINAVSRELRSCVSFAFRDAEDPQFKDSFEGSSSEVSFWCPFRASQDKSGYPPGIYRVTYLLDKESAALHRFVRTYGEELKKEGGSYGLLSSGVAGFELQYAFLEGDEVVWRDEWKGRGKDIPFGVKMILKYKAKDERDAAEFSETVLIPTGVVKETTQGSL